MLAIAVVRVAHAHMPVVAMRRMLLAVLALVLDEFLLPGVHDVLALKRRIRVSVLSVHLDGMSRIHHHLGLASLPNHVERRLVLRVISSYRGCYTVVLRWWFHRQRRRAW